MERTDEDLALLAEIDIGDVEEADAWWQRHAPGDYALLLRAEEDDDG